MNKLKKIKNNYLIDYPYFLQQTNFKNKHFKLKNILFENNILFSNNEFKLIELNSYQNIFVINLLNSKINQSIYTIQKKYESHLLLNYNLNYNLLNHFRFTLFHCKSKSAKQKSKFKTRVLGNQKVKYNFLSPKRQLYSHREKKKKKH